MSTNTDTRTLDPMKVWRDWFIQSEREWSEELTKLMKDDNVSRALGQEINAGLYRQQMMTQGMAVPLAMLNLPTREDITGLAERIGRIEDAVARVEAGLVQWRALQANTATKPPRTRKPAPAKKAAASRKTRR